jgi:hypothetical protein
MVHIAGFGRDQLLLLPEAVDDVNPPFGIAAMDVVVSAY